jgi:hypothetical protein
VVNSSKPVRRKWLSQIVPSVPATSSLRSIPPRKVQLTSNWPTAPLSKRMMAIALSSASIGWTRVSAQHMTSTGRLPLPTNDRTISMQWQPRSTTAPPPACSASQNQALCGPGWVSRLRTQRTSPMAPERVEASAFRVLGV